MKRNLPLILLAIVLLAAAVFSGSKLLGILFEYRQGESTYDELTQYVTTPAPTDPIDDGSHQEDTVPESPEEETNWPAVDFAALKAINDDVVGWIYLEGSKINYPIVQGEDNAYYLNRMYDGKGNGAGSIFMDYRCVGDFTAPNTVIYGHRMNNGTMFAQIANYGNHDFFYGNPHMLIMSPQGNYKLEIFSAYVANLADPSWNMSFDDQEDYRLWLADIQSRSYFERDLELTETDRIVTLSTCTYEFEDARFIVHGVLREAK